jgi:biopolymer transport protein ExbB
VFVDVLWVLDICTMRQIYSALWWFTYPKSPKTKQTKEKKVDIINYIDRGGVIVYLLIVLNIVGFSIILWKSFVLYTIKQNAIAQDILSFVKNNHKNIETKILDNILTKKMNHLEYGLNTIKIIASISPLLGLLGTVVGVLDSFDSISHAGLGDPTVFSAGISIALITTVAGMIVAIPHFIAYNYFVGALDKIENNIEAKVLEQL